MQTENLLTVAAIRKSPDGKTLEYLFNESPRIFEISPKIAGKEMAIAALDEAVTRKRPIKIAVDPLRNTINKIVAPSEAEIAEFMKLRSPLEKPEKPKTLNLEKIDHNTFNIVDEFLTVPLFKLCTKVVPNYQKAKEVFDYCAQQSCALPGPYGVNPCIPFQYVRDGCYARAHKMRWIITNKYKFCCEKVFSFANKNNDQLAVKATKCGGCCVTWWYHVAPLIRVQVKIGRLSFTKAMVIDPGMFDFPVSLSQWLAAQANTACSPRANVSMYSIQPGSAYAPLNYAGTQFSTDNNYVATDGTLTAYRNLRTCP